MKRKSIDPKKKSPTKGPSLMNPDYVYHPVSAGVNVQNTWRRYGWVPPSELKGVKNENTAA